MITITVLTTRVTAEVVGIFRLHGWGVGIRGRRSNRFALQKMILKQPTNERGSCEDSRVVFVETVQFSSLFFV